MAVRRENDVKKQDDNQTRVQRAEGSHARLLGRFLQGSLHLFVISILCSLCVSVLDLVNPRIIGYAVDTVIGNAADLPAFLARIPGIRHVFSGIGAAALAVVVLALLAALFRFLAGTFNAKGAEITVDGQGTTFLAAPEKSTSTIYTEAAMNTANTKDDDTERTGQQLKADESGEITVSFYIKHGQSVKLLGLPAGAKYTVTEAQEDYTPSVAVSETIAEGASYTADAAANAARNGISDSDTGIQGNTTAAFTNTREGTIPTGILSNVALPVGIIVLGVVGAAGSIIYIKKKKSEEE